MFKIFQYVIKDILRNRVILMYTLLLIAISASVFTLEDTGSKAILNMLNIILLIVPLVSIIFSTIYVYNSSEFIELLLSQPLHRKKIWMSIFAGLAVSLMLAFFVGVGVMVLLSQPNAVGILLVVCGLLLSGIFTSISMLAVVLTRDKARGIGASVMLWLYFSIIFDGLVLFCLFQFADYPLEKAMISVSMLNPIDLSRILILLKLDISALMGYTGAVFQDFFGTQKGLIFSFAALCMWIVVPIWVSLVKFNRKDL